MNDVAFLNTKKPNCGVYQYGKRLVSNLNTIQYYELETYDDLLNLLPTIKERILIFNYIKTGSPTGPFAWLTDDILNELRRSGKIVAQIYHAFDTLHFDYFLHQNPIVQDVDNIISLPRPLPKVSRDLITDRAVNVDCPIFGSFGLSNDEKNFPMLIRLVNDQFDAAKVRIHITNGYYGDVSGKKCDSIIQECLDIEVKPSINIEIEKSFLTTDDVVYFLSENDLNVFLYYHSGFGGVSSVVDYAIAAEKPVALGNSDMFSHIFSKDICVDYNSLSNIISLGSDNVLAWKEKWSLYNLQDKFDMFLKRAGCE